jgi:hypothetical protein
MRMFNSNDVQSHAPPLWRRVVCFALGLALAGCGPSGSASRPNTSPVVPQPPQAPQWNLQEAPRAAAQRPAASQPAAVALTANHDPCAIKLHDLCGPLLLYYSVYNRLPQSLDELRQLPGFENLTDFNCPVSHRPYIYTPQGEPGPDEEFLRENGPSVKVSSVIILADPTPVHGGIRWALSMQEQSDPSRGFVAKVIVLPANRSSR